MLQQGIHIPDGRSADPVFLFARKGGACRCADTPRPWHPPLPPDSQIPAPDPLVGYAATFRLWLQRHGSMDGSAWAGWMRGEARRDCRPVGRGGEQAENHVPVPSRGGEEVGPLGDPAGEEGGVVGRGRSCQWLGEWARFLAGGDDCPHWPAG